jgi:glycosyltransferase involved in cell wall biosynthesis
MMNSTSTAHGTSTPITVIATVYNEADHVHRLMRSLASQSRQPDAVIIVDGGSSDNTVEILKQYSEALPLHIDIQPRANISKGRNRAVQLAEDGIIAVTDAGVEFEPNWLEALTKPLIEDPSLDWVGGLFVADSRNTFETAMGATVLPLVDEIDPKTFLPSSRSVAFRKSVWQRSGGYPTWLDYCEDLIFDLRVRELTSNFSFAPSAVVRFRPRGSFGDFYRQYYLYARGDGKADLWRKRHAIRYVTYLLAAPLLLWLGWRTHRGFWLVGLAGGVVYLRRPYQRLLKLMPEAGRHSISDWLKAIGLVPLIRIVGDIAKMHGYPIGWLWRLRHHPPNWRELPVSEDAPAHIANKNDSQ